MRQEGVDGTQEGERGAGRGGWISFDFHNFSNLHDRIPLRRKGNAYLLSKKCSILGTRLMKIFSEHPLFQS